MIDISSELKDDEEIAKITTEDGTVIYDVNNPENTEDGYEYDPDDKTLTIPAGTSNSLTINAEKVKVLLFDALLTTNGRNYTRPTLNANNLKGKFATISSAYNAISNEGISFSRGIYIQLQADLTETVSLNGGFKNLTYDLNGHFLTGPTNNRAINATVSSGDKLNIIDGTLKNCSIGNTSLGGAMYVLNPIDPITGDRNWPYQDLSKWAEMNIFNVSFENNKAACGGAICINGAIKLNIFDSCFSGNQSQTSGIYLQRESSGAAIFVYESSTTASGEIVNLYDCEFTGNTGSGLFAMDEHAGNLLNIYGGKFSDNNLYGHGALIWLSAFNVYGGSFTDNELGTGTSADNSYSLYCGNYLFKNRPGSENYMANFGIYGGIVADNAAKNVININTDDNDNHERISFAGGSVGNVVAGNTDYDLSQKGLALASVTLTDDKQVEYVTYEGGTVNINSPFKIDRNGDVHYKFENGYDRISGDEFNGSEFNPAIDTFNVFLPSDKIDSIDSITVHFADGTTVDLNKTETTDGSVKFGN